MKDKNGNLIEVGTRFKYQVGTKYEAVIELQQRSGVLWLHFPNGDGFDMEGPVGNGWNEEVDSQLSEVIL